MTEKTQAIRYLEAQGIPYEVLRYPESLRDAVEVAAAIGRPPESVFKTLVVIPEVSGKKPILAMLPANAQLDLKRLAAAAGAKKLRMATQREAEQLTGLQVGGISALALLNRRFEQFLDESAAEQGHICVSAGRRGIQIRIATGELIRLTHAKSAGIATVPPDRNVTDGPR